MTKVNIKEASESITEDTSVIDSTGRVLQLKKPNALAQFRLADALGASAENRVVLGMSIPLTYLSAIDGETIMQPKTKLQIEALIQRLDDAGLHALNEGAEKFFSITGNEADKAKK